MNTRRVWYDRSPIELPPAARRRDKITLGNYFHAYRPLSASGKKKKSRGINIVRRLLVENYLPPDPITCDSSRNFLGGSRRSLGANVNARNVE